MSRCIVCGQKRNYKLFNPGPQPLAALNLPRSQQEACEELRFPMNFVSCAFCGHVYNTDFEYALIPYSEDSNRMYNSGSVWRDHLQYVIDKLVKYRDQWESGIAIDIGCGDGQFFSQLMSQMPKAACVGYEPGIEAEHIRDFTVIRDYFIPERDLKRFRPSLLVCRHVLEHMENPRDFVAEISFWCRTYNINPLLFFEVPCIDKALQLGRMSDFLYEHVSNFTVKSFKFLFSSSGYYPLELETTYANEVLIGLFDANMSQLAGINDRVKYFKQQVKVSKENVSNSLVVGPYYFWGGTGKSSAFLNLFGLNHDRYPYVVDSDANKVGRFVPGTGQKIKPVEWLLTQPIGVIVITTPWRARDIYNEIKAKNIVYRQLLVLWKGELQDYEKIAQQLSV